ncbi:hypothetical protein ZHAS_00011716 [Anopheles sinensis]|uniref:Uncharacterized protein n=1 Tax=Anopheles sinensis TaxID=74873 RepID=A0A084W0X1_ANOSI|nr:hypothetical protein ZHAS_00011716 [Anopheles sinensis]
MLTGHLRRLAKRQTHTQTPDYHSSQHDQAKEVLFGPTSGEELSEALDFRGSGYVKPTTDRHRVHERDFPKR